MLNGELLQRHADVEQRTQSTGANDAVEATDTHAMDATDTHTKDAVNADTRAHRRE